MNSLKKKTSLNSNNAVKILKYYHHHLKNEINE